MRSDALILDGQTLENLDVLTTEDGNSAYSQFWATLRFVHVFELSGPSSFLFNLHKSNFAGHAAGSLFHYLDHTCTAFGKVWGALSLGNELLLELP